MERSMFGDWRKRLPRFDGHKRLGHVTIWYDFSWYEVISHGRSTFPRGQRLAELVARDCEKVHSGTRRPGLILTARDDADEGAIDDGEYYAVVVRIRQYLDFVRVPRRADPAAAYFAERCRSGLTRVLRLVDVPDAPEAIAELGRRAAANPARFQAMADALAASGVVAQTSPGEAVAGPDSVSAQRAVEVLGALEAASPELMEAIIQILPRLTSGEDRRKLLDWLTEDEAGRRDTSAALGGRIADRILDIEEAIARFEALLQRQAGETDLQRFLTQHPWILGLEYARVDPHPAIFSSTMDFLLERFDGFHDIVELKGSGDDIITERSGGPGQATPPSGFALGSKLANAVAQAHVYRHMLMNPGSAALWQNAHRESRMPKIFIILGQRSALSPQGVQVLEELNQSLHRVEVLPYDDVGRRARRLVANIKTQLGVVAGGSTEHGG